MYKITSRLFLFVLAMQLVLGSYKGYVALFENGSKEPRQIYPYKTVTLPQQDQDSLAKGIPVHSDEHLQQLLEDYLS